VGKPTSLFFPSSEMTFMIPIAPQLLSKGYPKYRKDMQKRLRSNKVRVYLQNILQLW